MRYIPRKAKVKTQVFNNFTITDLIVAIVGVGIAAFIVTSNLPYKLYLALGFAALYVTLYIPIAEDVKMYFINYCFVDNYVVDEITTSLFDDCYEQVGKDF